jgi:hypothetical protein
MASARKITKAVSVCGLEAIIDHLEVAVHKLGQPLSGSTPPTGCPTRYFQDLWIGVVSGDLRFG